MKDANVRDTQLFHICLAGLPIYYCYVIEYPSDLSILLKGGKETNKDSRSSGEWTGTSPCGKPILGVVYLIEAKSLESDPIDGYRPVAQLMTVWVALLGNAEWMGGCDDPRLSIAENR